MSPVVYSSPKIYPQRSGIVLAASWDIQMAVQWPHWKLSELTAQTTLLQVNMEHSWHLQFEETESVATTGLHAANGRALNEPASCCIFVVSQPTFNLSFIPWRHSSDKLPQASPDFPYCMQWKTGQRPGNELNFTVHLVCKIAIVQNSCTTRLEPLGGRERIWVWICVYACVMCMCVVCVSTRVQDWQTCRS